MKIICRGILEEFKRKHPDVRSQVDAWLADVFATTWSTTMDIKRRYASASFVNDDVIFNLKGNKYRLKVQVNYKNQIVLIKAIGTHDQYMKW
ncbi:MAG: addiction module toxin RelE [Deltaproteobacteria bacterium CG11_big_fil_rev_8_21_14_0_20_49_13]|nr:MAG: addiction module toxin RelE [Deltaproteobacteria bacterium CG11_big_fil_rev_8_21_14_0_20_49_13]